MKRTRESREPSTQSYDAKGLHAFLSELLIKKGDNGGDLRNDGTYLERGNSKCTTYMHFIHKKNPTKHANLAVARELLVNNEAIISVESTDLPPVYLFRLGDMATTTMYGAAFADIEGDEGEYVAVVIASKTGRPVKINNPTDYINPALLAA